MKNAKPEAMSAETLRYVEKLALVMTQTGFPRMPARMMACLLCAPEEGLTAAELSTFLHVSRAAVSGALKYLMQVSLVERERRPRERVDRFHVGVETLYASFMRRDELMNRWLLSMQEGVTVLGRRSVAGRRLDEAREFFDYVRTEMPKMLEKWHRLRASR